MAAYLKRLLGALGAYQIASILQKLLAVLLLPVYTGRIAPGGHGIVETLATFVIFVSIVARFGIIESFLRYYFIDEDPARRDALVRRSVLFLVATTTVTCAVLVIPAAPLARLITSEHVPAAFRWSVLGIWSFTNLELAQAVLRVDERLRAYAIVNSINVAVTVAASLVLVIGLNKGYEGLLIANFGTSTVVLFGLWWHLRRRLNLIPAGTAAESFRTLFRFGLPTVPAEASVYALSVLDRQYIVHSQGTYAAGRYAIAMKVAGAIAFIVTAFQYAWPPLAYSVGDDAQAARLYSLVTTYYALITGWVVAGLALEDRFIIRLLTPHPGYFGSYRAIPWVSLGWAMYGLWVVLLVVAGRAKITSRNFPAALVGLVVNVVLLIVLVPRFGIAGGGIALCGAYVAMLGVMHMLIRRAFPVSFEWRRLAQLAVVIGGLAVAGDLLLPTSGLGGFVTRALVFLAIGPVLWVTGFVHRAELDQGLATLRGLRGRIGSA
ncbi:MAG TPA: lipopolysaccharide biosynthesis protein [Solirubrobacteraceae bacterium]|nr:lipopolysaccharide biosynthesis protein [Solirubrobacteraceae bacterium]